MIETFCVDLPHGITLSCRASGPPGAPLVILLHGFPEAAFVWDAILARLAGRFRCVAPNLRGFEHSSAPAGALAYRLKHVVADIVALAAHCNRSAGRAAEAPLAALVGHDWGGAIAWGLAAQQPDRLLRLVILNSPHPATFLRELQHSPAQRKASAYMTFLCRDDAAERLAANDFARMWPLFASAEGEGAPDWLTDEMKENYRAVWRRGLQGALNYYRASPLRPPTNADDAILSLAFEPQAVTVRVPTRVIWGERDKALLPALLDGLDAFVPMLRVVRVPDASHWIVHEQPALVAREIEAALAG
jgi:pimeloyl-ACP methyl ester carboxylesterase